MRGGGTEVGFAADEDDGDLGAADGADFFYPLCLVSVRAERAGDGRASGCEETRTFTVTFSSESGVSMAKAMSVRTAERKERREAMRETAMCVEKEKRRAMKVTPVAGERR